MTGYMDGDEIPLGEEDIVGAFLVELIDLITSR
jgi:hypothetical protein